MLPKASLDDVCMMYLLKDDSFSVLHGDFYLKSYVLQMRSRGLFFVNMFIYIYIYIYIILPGVYMSQMVNVFYMSFMCLLQFIYSEPCLIFMS